MLDGCSSSLSFADIDALWDNAYDSWIDIKVFSDAAAGTQHDALIAATIKSLWTA